MATSLTANSVVNGPDLDLLENFPLIESDGVPLESAWHVYNITLLIDSILVHFADRTDFYVGGNMFIYFNLEQARNRDFRGPDFFFVKESHFLPLRPYWAVWLECGRYPDVIIELLSPATAQEDRTTKKTVYERTFHTAEYFCYDPDSQLLEGWQLGAKRRYVAISPNERGWLWSEELGLWVGTWKGEYRRTEQTWLRFYDTNGHLVPIKEEIATQRAEAAEAELARLKKLLAQQGISTEPAEQSPPA
jgi:Uma2 family endonuclease